jgi:uncharacterized protein (PEP-CTERM system associated)
MSALIAAAVVPTKASALEWDVTPTISASTTATDNSSQSASNSQGSLITTLSPGINFVSKGSHRVQADFSYHATGVVRVGGTDQSNDIYHNLAADGKAELIDNFLYIDGNANVSQQLISLLGSPADANTNGTNNTTVGTYSISPYIEKRLGSVANALLRYSRTGAIFQNNVASNTQADQVIAALSSGSQFDVIDWSLNYSERHASYASAGALASSTSTFGSESATLGVKLTRKLRVFATLGRDSNDFINSAQLNGDFYTAGFEWAPSQRTNLQMSAGKRYIGNSYSLSFRHTGHYTVWNAAYSESVSDFTQQSIGISDQTYLSCPTQAIPITPILVPSANVPAGCSVVTASQVNDLLYQYSAGSAAALSPYGQALLASTLSLGITNGIFINKQFQNDVNWNYRKVGLGLSIFDTRRVYVLKGNQEDHYSGITGSATYRLTPTMNASGSLGFTNFKTPGTISGLLVNRSDNLYTLSLGLTRRFDPTLTGTLFFLHQTRQSNESTGNFDSNSITASFIKTF